MTNDGITFTTAGDIYIRDLSGEYVEALVSNVSGDNPSYENNPWLGVSPSFDDPYATVWNRPGHTWELIAFQDNNDNHAGFYVEVGRFTTYVTFRSFTDIEIKAISPP